MNDYTSPAEPCPNCDKPDTARQGSSTWGHGYMCCSPACGLAFGDSSKRCRLEIDKLLLVQADAERKIEIWSKAADAARLRERPGERRETALALMADVFQPYDLVTEALAAGEVTPEEVVAPLLAWCREKAATNV